MSNDVTRHQPDPSVPIPEAPKTDKSKSIIRETVAFKPDGGGPYLLRRELAPNETSNLKNDKYQLARFVRPLGENNTEKARLLTALAQLFLGYGTTSRDDAGARAQSFMEILSELPLGAVLRAIDDIRHDRVDDVDAAFPPSSHQIFKQAKKYVAEAHAEILRIDNTLSATVDTAEVSAERRKELAQEMLKHSQKIREETDERLDPVKIKERADEAVSLRDKQILAEYRQHGIEPRYADKNKTMLVSLSMVRKLTTNIDLDSQCREREKKWNGQ